MGAENEGPVPAAAEAATTEPAAGAGVIPEVTAPIDLSGLASFEGWAGVTLEVPAASEGLPAVLGWMLRDDAAPAPEGPEMRPVERSDLAPALRLLEGTMRELLAAERGIACDRISVVLAPEARVGRDGLRIDVLVDGAVDLEAERHLATLLTLCAGAVERIS